MVYYSIIELKNPFFAKKGVFWWETDKPHLKKIRNIKYIKNTSATIFYLANGQKLKKLRQFKVLS